MASEKEEEYVHKVYNEIASHFSQTRYKPWPIVTKFLNEQPIGSIGIDVGCGNGKYLNVNPNIFIIGSDRSDGLIKCAHEINGQYNVLVADGMCLPHRDNTFDFAISIAVVHHWSTRERRVQAINHILNKVKSGSQILIYCWALEQSTSRRGYHEGMEQDILVPWVLQEKNKKKKDANDSDKSKNKKDLIKSDLSGIPPKERASYMAKWKKKQEDIRNERERKEKESQQIRHEEKNEIIKYRYYHLYREGELEEDCISAGAKIITSGYERDNWYVIAKKP